VALRGTLIDRIIAAIEAFVADAGLGVGDRLPPERDLARILQVSRPSLREALRALQARGRLRILHGQGVFIDDANPLREAMGNVGLVELFAMREVLEVPAAGWAAKHASAADVTRLGDVLDRLDEVAAREPLPLEALARLDGAFHVTVAEIAGNRFLLKTTELLQEMLGTSMQTTLAIPGRLATSRADHHRILDDIARRDAKVASADMRRHIRGARQAALSRAGG
jgi:GntR family transcriptional regulator, transcriptional repressor for pyruvate dehydrogenase complex